MFLIDKPFVSDFLIDTIRDENYPIIATEAAKELIDDERLAWIKEAEAIAILKDNPEVLLYSNSENALDWIVQHWGESDLARQIQVLKDKASFRTLIQKMFPDFYFKKYKLAEVHRLPTAALPYPFVIKPSIGFFSIGVHIVKDEADWKLAKEQLQPEKLQSIFPENVLNTSDFIIEEYISGEEYAIDYYYDQDGKVVLLNVLHHLFSSGTDTSDRVYSTSKAIMEEYQSGLEDFLGQIGEQLQLKNFPAHAEVRIDGKGKIVPIEINPLRFGGWCTTGDLLGLTLGFNAYQCFLEKKKPNWEELFKGQEEDQFSIIVLDNNSGIPAADILAFDYSALAKDFERPVLIRKIDIHKYPVFGFVFAQTSKGKEKELTDILSSDLRKYITSK